MPYCDLDRAQHGRLLRWVSTRTRHRVLPLYSPPDGVVRPWGFCIRPGLAYVTCNQLWCGMVRRLPDNTRFLWLEPDCVPTRVSSLDEIETAWNAASVSMPELSVFGHDKRDQWPDRFKFLSGVSVYRVTPALRSVAASISNHKAHDMEIGRELIGTEYVCGTQLIRCVWGFKSEPYLARYGREGGEVVRQHPEAALIHGDREGDVWKACWGEGEPL